MRSLSASVEHRRLSSMKALLIGATLLMCGCVIVVPAKEEEPKDCANSEGPWYSEQFLEENPQYKADMYLCSNYYKHEERWSLKGGRWIRHTVPIRCGTEDGFCGVVTCECVCHK